MRYATIKMRSILLILLFLPLCGCEKTDVSFARKISISDEKHFKDLLSGTWILRSYRDSINNGLTPRECAVLLHSVCRVVYKPYENYLFVLPKDSSYIIFIDYWQQPSLTVKFNKEKNEGVLSRKEFSTMYDTVEHRWIEKVSSPILIGTLSFSVVSSDTILNLIIYKDSVQIRSELIKQDDYDVFLNKKFIAGDYYIHNNKNDSVIVSFTEQGRVKGLETLDESFSRANAYSISMDYFPNNRNCLSFYCTSNKSVFPMVDWRVAKDTLILEQIDFVNSKKQYVLLKKTKRKVS